MKGLRKYLTPFAPDQSGAESVLYPYGGMIVILDAGGCTGNVCGFDESRWFKERAAVFSAGLRDMDAIMGRDRELVEKLKAASARIDARFIALIGTPVPAVIGTDYQALKRMTEKSTGLPVLPIATNGIRLYDKGAELAYMALFKELSEDLPEKAVKTHRIGVLGLNPLDSVSGQDARKVRMLLEKEGFSQVSVYGMDADLEAVVRAGEAEKNLVVSPSGLKAARYLEERFGVPYDIDHPLAAGLTEAVPVSMLSGKRILILHQQVLASSIRRRLREVLHAETEIVCAGYFMMMPELMEADDRELHEEDDFLGLVRDGSFDVIVADPVFKRMLPGFNGLFIPLAEPAVSGRFTEDN